MQTRMIEKRRTHEAPVAIARLGWRYHHLGIPHTVPRAEEQHLDHLAVHVCGFETSLYGIEWMRFDPDCPVPAIVKTVPHIAFAVDDLDEALKGDPDCADLTFDRRSGRIHTRRWSAR